MKCSIYDGLFNSTVHVAFEKEDEQITETDNINSQGPFIDHWRPNSLEDVPKPFLKELSEAYIRQREIRELTKLSESCRKLPVQAESFVYAITW